MTQLGEMVAVGMTKESKVDCPFHEEEHKCGSDVKNAYKEGNAETLGINLVSGDKESSSTVQRGKGTPDDRYRMNKKAEDPDDLPESSREVYLIEKDEDCKYPVAFAAHHLIPGKASMGQAKALHKFIREGKICCNLGYSVDGNENGVWLPGLHAVNKNGLNLWSSKVAPRSLPDKEDVARIGKIKAKLRKELQAEAGGKRQKFSYKPIVGPTPGGAGTGAFRDDNLKWLYVQKSMSFLGGVRQFHDAHPAYSSEIKNQLLAVAEKLGQLLERSQLKSATQCTECKSQQGEKLPTPPIGLLGLLNRTSSHYRTILTTETKHQTIYTSSWCGPESVKVKPRVATKLK